MGRYRIHQGESGVERHPLRRQKHTSLPIIVKGVQSVDDVELCVKAGVEGVLIVSLSTVA